MTNVLSRKTRQQNCVVLVVEDDADVRQFLQLALEDEGFTTTAIGDGGSALQWAANHEPSLAILDYALPVLGGSAVAAGLRARYGSHVPIILITADSSPGEKARLLGADVSLAKPFDLSVLLDAVERLTGVA